MRKMIEKNETRAWKALSVMVLNIFDEKYISCHKQWLGE